MSQPPSWVIVMPGAFLFLDGNFFLVTAASFMTWILAIAMDLSHNAIVGLIFSYRPMYYWILLETPLMKRFFLAFLLCFFCFESAGFGIADDWRKIHDDFVTPPQHFHSRPLWFWNKVPNREETIAQMKRAFESGYAGLAILPAFHDPAMKFMSREFLEQYKVAADTARELGIKLCLYDEFWFPSGSAGGLMKEQYPEHLCKRLDMVEVDTETEAEVSLNIPEGTLMGCVLMNRETFARQNITSHVENGVLRWSRPEGDRNRYKIMIFVCVLDGERDLVDYLEPQSMQKFVELTYAGYQKAMPEHFGTTIDSAFYDEPMLYTPGSGQAWTPKFNEYFTARFGYDPVPLYPAMFMDIGPETMSARNALFGFRATLFSEGFVKTITDWLKPFGVPLTGHLDQEEVVNPTGVTGDVIKFFEYQDIPGLDQIFKYGRGSKMYKLISSAATNYDKNLVMTEVYGAEGRIPVDILYREAMDQAAKGVNMFVPHAVWYDPKAMPAGMQPELSAYDPLYGPVLPEYNCYIGRIHLLMQKPGRHVADIAVLYPIESLQSTYHFNGPISAYEGGVPGTEDNYLNLGETLSFEIHRDFTFLHPETLKNRCKIVPRGIMTDKVSLQLDNVQNPAEFSTLIIPSMKTIGVATLERIRDYYNAGGSVVAVGTLPQYSAEPGMNDRIEPLLREIFGDHALNESAPGSVSVHENKAKGKAFTIRAAAIPESETPTAIPTSALQSVLNDISIADLTFLENKTSGGKPLPTSSATGSFNYRHLVIDSRDVYFFSNSTDEKVDTTVSIRGIFTKLSWWNPHNGETTVITNAAGFDKYTRIPLALEPVSSLFLITEP